MNASAYGISGCALYVPPYRVKLESWCQWTGNPWEKVRRVVGDSFRMAGPSEDAYTMAAEAVLRLIRNYDVDPSTIGYLALATESSTDNAIGGVIVKGMVNQALKTMGLPELPRSCEVPEIKQACLAGLYALKGATRYLALDGKGKQAIIVSSDIAAYQRGSTGEQTQGAGAVAMLVSEDPTMLEVHLDACGAASAYRSVDFRKPIKRYLHPDYRPGTTLIHDFPVFNGTYSTACFIDATRHAMEDMVGKLGVELCDYMENVAAIFAHRPYRRMPATALAVCYILGMARESGRRDALEALCESAGVDMGQVISEASSNPDLFAMVEEGNIDTSPYPATMSLARVFRDTPEHACAVAGKTRLGADMAAGFGNLYTAALPAWLAAGMYDAFLRDEELAGSTVVALGYGSGDASEAMPMRVAAKWREAAARIDVPSAVDGAVDLTVEQYEILHDTGMIDLSSSEGAGGFRIARTGSQQTPGIDDAGVDYYTWSNR